LLFGALSIAATYTDMEVMTAPDPPVVNLTALMEFLSDESVVPPTVVVPYVLEFLLVPKAIRPSFLKLATVSLLELLK
jgi:hypothetical protein